MKLPNQMRDESLTEMEVFGLRSRFNLADGHSYLDASAIYPEVLGRLGDIWRFAAESSIPHMENYFRDVFSDFYSLNGLRLQSHYSICPTASNSIDIVGAWARSTRATVGLIEPTFDNLALLLKRRGVNLHAIREACVHDVMCLEKVVEDKRMTALFLVNPNNPTGRVLDSNKLKDIIELCVRKQITLILDVSFRFCHKSHLDEYMMMREAGASFLILEDTGKIWPVLDTKASILAYSEDLAPLVRRIYEEVYLCSSNFSLALIGAFIESTARRGGRSFVHQILSGRHGDLRAALRGLPVRIENDSADAIMSVAWLSVGETGLTDLEFVNYMSTYELAVLPGRYFYWNSHLINGHRNVRLALLKPREQYSSAIRVLKTALEDLTQPRFARTSALF